jgi:hypothetical protein
MLCLTAAGVAAVEILKVNISQLSLARWCFGMLTVVGFGVLSFEVSKPKRRGRK